MKKFKISRLNHSLANIVLAVLTCLLLTAFLLAVCACEKHEHSFAESVTKQPTCQQKGEKTFTCSCGEKYTEEIPVVDHKYTQTGFDETQHWKACEFCGDKKDVSNHTLAYVVDESEHHLACVDCAFAEAAEKHNHSVFVARVNSTCQQEGQETYKCVCGHTSVSDLPLGEHDYTATKSNADCHWSVCAVCGTENPNGERIAHAWKVVEVTLQATCTQTGNEKVACDCGYEKARQTSALGHDFSTLVLGESNNNGHRLKCNRCENFIFVNHSSMSDEFVGDDCACPDGHNRQATCYQTGHQDKLCKICNNAFHTILPKTDEHNFSTEWTTNGTSHWHVCTNGDGKCTAKSDEASHAFQTVVKQPTCSETGHQSNVCSECGAVQSGSNKTLEKLPHDYETVEVVQQATCFLPLKEKQVCKVCHDEREATGERLEHVWSDYQAGQNGKHFKECSRCHTKNEGNHDVRTRVTPAATCGEEEITQQYCSVCGYVLSETRKVKEHRLVASVDENAIPCGTGYEVTYSCQDCTYSETQHKTKQHEYSFDRDVKDATCISYGTYYEICINCQNKRLVEDEEGGYGNHNLHRVKARSATETDVGIAYDCYQCTLCNHYLADNQNLSCRDYVDDEVVIPKIETIVVDTIGQLEEHFINYTGSEPSVDFYKITVVVGSIDIDNNTVLFVDDETGSESTWVISVPTNVNIATLAEGNVVTLRGHLTNESDELLTGVEFLSVDDGDAETCSLYINCNEDGYAYVNYGSDYFYSNVYNFNCLLLNDSIIFNCYPNNPNKVLQSAVINGRSYTVTNGVLDDIAVNGDVYAEFVFGDKNGNQLVVDEIETGVWNANPYALNGYVTCEYDGSTNDTGALNKNSRTRFTVENAYITGIVIEFVAEDVAYVGNNEIFVGTDKDHKGDALSYTISNRNKVTLGFAESDALTYFEYAATSHQAHIVSITIQYNTYNTLSRG